MNVQAGYASGQWWVPAGCEQGMILCLRAVKIDCLLWTRYDSVTQSSGEWLPDVNKIWFCHSGQWRVAAYCEQCMTVTQGSDEWLPAVNNKWFCDSEQRRVAACCEQQIILWLRAVTSGCQLWTINYSVTQGSDEWLPAVNNKWFCDSGQWRVAACWEQYMILWLRAVTSGCLLWTRYDSVTQCSDECLASVTTVWFFEFNKNMEWTDSVEVLSFSKMIVRNYVGS